MDAATISAFDIAIVSGALLSLAALFYQFQKHIAGRSLLPYQPRRRVPWGPLVALLAMGLPILTITAYSISLFAGDQATTSEISIESFLIMGSFDSLLKIIFVFGISAVLITTFRADAHDLGFPTSWKQLTSDIGIGTIACLAALLPINLVQFALVNAFESKTLHPLVEQLQENHSPAILLLSFAMAVIVAPLFEEFTFRSLLQGWLERREDEVLGYASTERQPPCIANEIEVIGDREIDGEEEEEEEEEEDIRRSVARRLFDDTPDPNEATSLRLEPESLTIETVPPNTTRPTQGWIPDLPHGWTPILISGAAFGLAHIGHGVAPISLVLFGIVLGYLYQRTHRLVPSITAHMLFNAYSMVLLWLQLETPPVG